MRATVLPSLLVLLLAPPALAQGPSSIEVHTEHATGTPRALTVEAFLSEQVSQAFQPAPAGPGIRIVLDWPDGQRLRAAVWADGEALAEREIDGISDDNLDDVCALAWLFVRSSIARRLQVDTSSAAETPAIPAATAPLTATATTAAAPAAIEAQSAPLTAAPLTPAGSSADHRPAAPSESYDGFALRILNAPVSMGAVHDVSLVLLTGGVVDAGGFNMGGGLGARLRAGGIDAGFDIVHRGEQRATDLSIDHTAFGFSLGVEPFHELPLELGGRLALDVQQAVTPARTLLTVGASTGPYARMRWSLVELGGSAELALFAESALTLALLRHSYRTPDGVDHVDGVVGLNLSTGLEWRWR